MLTTCLASWNSVVIERFSGSDRAFCVREFYKNADWPTIARRTFSCHRGMCNLNAKPSVFFIRKWVEKFEGTGSTLENPKSGRPRSSRTYESVESVNQSMHDDPNLSIRKHAKALNVHRSSLPAFCTKT